MREIKFRIWDERTKKMSPEFIFFGQVPADLNIMQYTGLKDKNGKEIYEGDIIHIQQCECTGYDENDNEIWESVDGEVSFEDGLFVFSGHSAGTLPICAYKGDLEVVGNVYENPELLEP